MWDLQACSQSCGERRTRDGEACPEGGLEDHEQQQDSNDRNRRRRFLQGFQSVQPEGIQQLIQIFPKSFKIMLRFIQK